ncbi:MAG TPA: PDZ domain-containing protein, partial [Blastocatellia bacterium]|nr:PDZ domain-containing protein [Blastocatellia bacterium]
MTKLFVTAAFVLMAAATSAFGQAERPLLIQKPALSRTQIVFSYADDLWIVGRDGGVATRLTASPGVETNPAFSPDGTMVAFTGEYDGNLDVYVVPAAGGVPKRLTYHPSADMVLGWTPDGKNVIFTSNRDAYSPRFSRLFTVSIDGGFEAEIPLPMGFEASYSPDGSRLAYMPLPDNPFPGVGLYQAWKRYRGGLTTPIWLANLSDSSIERVPRDNSNDFNPMWVGDNVYFLSDRNGRATLFSYNASTKKVTELIHSPAMDIKSASAAPDAIVYEQLGSISLYDVATGKSHRVNVEVNGDLTAVRPHFQKVGEQISTGRLSPTGVRAVFEARGEIFTVPAEKGDVRDLTNTPGAAERDPAWSPDGKWIAYFSDESGEYALHLRDQSGMGDVRKINLGDAPSFYYSPVWSPDSKKIAYQDKRLNLWYLDIEKGTSVKVDTTTYDSPFQIFDQGWSPDSRWIVYTKQLENRFCAVFVYSLETGEKHQITDGLSDARYSSFDGSGKYIYFTASTNIGPTTGWLDMSSFGHPVNRSAYLVVLQKGQPSPLAPESDEEKAAPAEGSSPAPDAAQKPAGAGGEKKDAGAAAGGSKDQKKEPEPVKIDFERISQRILALPLPPRNYIGMLAGKAGTAYLLATPEGLSALAGPGAGGAVLYKFDMKERKADVLAQGITSFDLSANGEKMLYQMGPGWFIAPAGAPVKPGEGALKTSQMEAYVDPRAEWKQMFDETWRIERDFFYDPNYHGLDLKATEAKYRPYLEGVGSRSDLNHLFVDMLGELTVGHLFVRGGDLAHGDPVPVGLLGTDYKIENGRYRFARVFDGENWNPQLHAPLTQPGVDVSPGEYLLAVNGREVKGTDNVYSFFEETAGKQVVLKVGPDPGGANSREVTVVPIRDESGLRNLAWIEDNRRKVDQLSGGTLAYVYLPDTAGGGYTNFNRYYFPQITKEGAVIDERFNSGGAAADYIIDYMRRPLMNYWATREGRPFTTPIGSIYGPKAMIINQYGGSGGDLMPWLFRHSKIGPLIGERTWGGLVGIYG